MTKPFTQANGNADCLRWKKKMGNARNCKEKVFQHGWLLIPYSAIIATITLVLMLKGY